MHGRVQAVGVLSDSIRMTITILSGNEGTSEVVTLIDLDAFLFGGTLVGSDDSNRYFRRYASCLRQD